MGGISGHAGFFSTAPDLLLLVREWMFAASGGGGGGGGTLLNATTTKLWTAEYNHTQSSRALGWNTNDYTVNDRGWDQSCGSLSQATFMHDGYTGTMICGDTKRNLILILLTNRVYPDDSAASKKSIHGVRQTFGNLVQKAYDACPACQ